MKPDTALIHHGSVAPQDFHSPQIAVHKASSVFFPNVAALRDRNWLDKTGYTYGLHGTPTTFTHTAGAAPPTSSTGPPYAHPAINRKATRL